LQIEFVLWLIILLCIALVFITECINTAIESLVDLVAPAYSELARHAKDAAAAAVLISAFISLVVGGAIFVRALIGLFEGIFL
jgi:undecaprenol kinase/diacylglycerol kinase (ATP)